MCIFDAGDGVQEHREDGGTGVVPSGKCIIQGGRANPRLVDQSIEGARSGEIAHGAWSASRDDGVSIVSAHELMLIEMLFVSGSLLDELRKSCSLLPVLNKITWIRVRTSGSSRLDAFNQLSFKNAYT